MLYRRSVLLPQDDDTFVLALIEGGLQRVEQAQLVVAAVRHCHAVDEQAVVGGIEVTLGSHDLRDIDKLAVPGHQPGITALDENVELGAQVAPLGDNDFSQQCQADAVGVGVDMLDYVVGRVLLDKVSRDGRERPAHAGKQQPQVVIDLGARAHGAARVARDGALLDSDGWRQSVDEVAVGLGHAAHELAGIGRQALDIAALTLGIQRVERQRRLAAARQARHDDKLAARYRHVNVLEVVDTSPLDDDVT